VTEGRVKDGTHPNNLGWVLLKQNKDTAAKTRFDQALALHPSGVDAAGGLIRYGINTGDATLAETWATRKAQMQGKAVQIGLADLHASWAIRLENRYAYQEAIAHYQAAFASGLTNVSSIAHSDLGCWAYEKAQPSPPRPEY